MSKPTKKQINDALDYFQDFPPEYDAYNDRLSDRDDLAMQINEMLRHVRVLMEIVKK